MGIEKMKILIVEDNSPDAFLLVEAFQEFGKGDFELSRASDLDDALMRVSQEKIDAILLDLSLPIFLGLEPLTRVHQLRPQTPIFVLSGYADPKLAEEAVKLGAKGYIVKNKLDSAGLIALLRSSVEANRKSPPPETTKKNP